MAKVETRLSLSRGRKAVVAAVVAGVLSVSTARDAFAGAVCWTADNRSALRSRVLQSDLMVAALSCGLRTEYNDFVRRFSNPLALKGRILKAMFRENLGPGYHKLLDRFVTRLANQSSIRSLRNRDVFCADASRIIEVGTSMSPDDYSILVDVYGYGHLHGIPACHVANKRDSRMAEAG